MHTLEQAPPYPSSIASNSASKQAAVLHLLCGRIAAGKSTLAKALAHRHNAILIGEDNSLSQLYPDKIRTFSDYLAYSEQFKKFITPHCIQLLQQSVDIVLDFPANTPTSRRWFKKIISAAKARHLLHYLTTPVEQCKRQLQQRIAEQGADRNIIALEKFDEINGYFVPPSVEEGFNVEIDH